jgi:hypothetical protein
MSGQFLSVEKVPLDLGMVVRAYAWLIGGLVGLLALAHFGDPILRALHLS